MLARVQKIADEPPLAERLSLPPAPTDLVRKADEKVREAIAERQAAEGRHREALARLQAESAHNAGAGRDYHLPTITHAEVDELAAPIRALQDAEHAAKNTAADIRERYQQSVNEVLAAPLMDLQREIARKLDEIDRLLELGVRLHSDANRAGVRLPSKLPGGCSALMTHGTFMCRKIIARIGSEG